MRKGNHFIDIFRGKTVLVGIGNTLRGDDGAGALLVERLFGRIGAVCINAGQSPERFMGKIVSEKPDRVLIVDAVHLDLDPGSYVVIAPGELVGCTMSTHDITLGMLIDYLASQIKAQVFILGIQPARIRIGDALSPEVEKTLHTLEGLILDAAPRTVH